MGACIFENPGHSVRALASFIESILRESFSESIYFWKWVSFNESINGSQFSEMGQLWKWESLGEILLHIITSIEKHKRGMGDMSPLKFLVGDILP